MGGLKMTRGQIPLHRKGEKNRTGHRPGLTLIEMLVAVTITLMMMAAVVQIFGMIGENITQARAILELNEQLRYAVRLLQEDLEKMMVPRPWVWAINRDHRLVQADLEGTRNPLSMAPPTVGYLKYQNKELNQNKELKFTRCATISSETLPEAPPMEIVWWVRESGESYFQDGKKKSLYQLYRSVPRSSGSSGSVPLDAEKDLILDHVVEFEVKFDSHTDQDQWDSETWPYNWNIPAQYDGFDNNANGLVDEPGEREEDEPGEREEGSSGPSGLRITISVREPDTGQIRTVVVAHAFGAEILKKYR